MSTLTFDTFDSDFYYRKYPDLQLASCHLRGQDRAQFLYTHYIRHGRFENRKYQIRGYAYSKLPRLIKSDALIDESDSGYESVNGNDSSQDDNTPFDHVIKLSHHNAQSQPIKWHMALSRK